MAATGFPLSFGQQRLWLVEQVRADSAEYTVPFGWRLSGSLDPAALQRALTALVSRHEVLRTRYVSTDGVPEQVVDPPGAPEWAVVNLLELSSARRESRLRELIDQAADRPFRLEAEWPVRATLFRLAPEEHVLLLVQHHIANDGRSRDVLTRDLGELYRAESAGGPAQLPELPVQYADFAGWQRETTTDAVLQRQLGYWRDRLAGMEPLELLPDRPRPSVWRADGGEARFTVPSSVSRALAELARSERATPYMTLLTAVLVLFSRYTGRADVSVGTPLSGRGRPELQDLIGLFVSTLVIRADLAGQPTFREAVGRVRRACLDAYQHQDLPFERLVEELAPERDLSRNPLFQIMVSYVAGDRPCLDLRGVRAEREPMPADSPAFDLSIELTEAIGGGLTGLITYAAGLFEAATIARFAADLTQLLAAAAAEPDRAIGDLPLLTGDTRNQVLVEWNRTAVPRPEACVHELIAQHAARTPDALAVAGPSGELSYRQLDQRANALAQQLRVLGAGLETPVGVCLPRDTGLVVGLLAVLKAGAAYLPVDLDQPEERTARALGEAGVSVVLGHPASAGRLPGGIRLVRPDETQFAAEPPSTGAGPDSLLYVLYTSGSTGEPKGTLITHQGMVNRALWGARHLRPSDRVLHKTALTFDAAGWELWAPLITGATLVTAAPDVERDPAALVRAVADHRATVLQVVPSMLRLLVEEPGLPGCTSLRLVFAGGERLTAELGDRVTELLDAELHNLYGPTECTIDVTSWPYTKGDRVAIGAPIDNVRVYVLDARGNPVPVGVPGELYVGGPGLARGYLGRAALTAERFVPDRFGDGDRLYRTGDQVRWLPDGHLEFLGRLDDQVKVGGVRIELGEVESALSRHPGVTGVAVAARTDRLGDTFLVAYYEPAGIAPAAMRDFAASLLPSTAVPARFVPLAELPRTTGGKVDRPALPTAEPEAEGAYVEPRSTTERRVAEIVAAVLGLDRIGLHDDFFRLGGHSLLAVRAAARLRAELSTELPVRLLFEASTVERIARAVETATTTRRVVIPAAPRDVPPPASSGQQRLAFLNRLRPDQPEYLVTVAARLRGPLDVESLADAVHELVTRHEALRTRYAVRDGRIVQVIDPPEVIELSRVDAEHVRHDIAEFVTQVSSRGFSLDEEPPLRATLARIGEADHVLVLAMHHMACDARSIEVIVHELGELYAHRPLPPLPVRFADFAVWEQQWLRSEEAAAQLEFWRERLRGAVPLELPTDRPRSPEAGNTGAAVEFRVPAPLARALSEIGRAEAATPFMTMLAAFTVLLAERTGQRDIVLGTTVAGRPLPALENLVGPFLNSVVLRADLTTSRTFGSVIRHVRDSALAAFANQDLPFQSVVEALRPDRDPARNPLFQVQFELEPYGGGELRFGDVLAEPVRADRQVAKVDLALHLGEQRDGSYCGSLLYPVALFTDDTAQRIVAGFLDVVERAAAGRLDLSAGGGPAALPAETERPLATDEPGVVLTPAEEILAGIWEDVLDLDRIGRQDNFFHLGGHSLYAIEVHMRLQEEFDIDLPLRALFDAPTLRELAVVIDQAVPDKNKPVSGTEGGSNE
ncbi:amino acid adenylation domain-containing protein [Amycolatopsis sp. NPDC051758]|uniref:amino acid adenylation domain-containing protein n=1 Tax=Amycolatopsis sp. NPDC051758 TaxID=3363935 RepID=UPI0037A35D14